MLEHPSASLLKIIREAWAWRGFDPTILVDLNPFGGAILECADGAFWRITPEELSLEQIASDPAEFGALQADTDFLLDWQMEALVALAKEKLGEPAPGRCYYFVTPTVLGGAYVAANMQTLSLAELHSLTGDLARQIDGLPDGTKVVLTTDRPADGAS